MPNTWYIYYINNCPQSSPPSDKLVIIVCKDVKPMGFFINKGIRPFVWNNPDLFACQVVIRASHHKCLRYDSYVDCGDLKTFDDTQLTEGREPVHSQTKAEIKNAVSNARVLSKREMDLILGN